MFEVLRDRGFRRLFSAQVVALLGTGLASVALGLMAYDLAGGAAGQVLGVVFAIKMVAYVLVGPLSVALVARWSRRRVLVALDGIRAAVAVTLPFVDQIWQIYLLIFLLQSASAAFTPVFQASLPDILPEEERYTKGLSLSRLAYDLENILSPALAGLVLLWFSYQALFLGTVFGFVASGILILGVVIPAAQSQGDSLAQTPWQRMRLGLRQYVATPRLRGLMALNLSVASAGSMVLVNSVVLVRADLALSEVHLAVTMGVFGAGSMIAALALPRVLAQAADRSVMLWGASLMALSLIALSLGVAVLGLRWSLLLTCWLVLGLGFSLVLTPSARLLRRSSHGDGRAAIFAAQFALSHLCWLIAYPLAGWLLPWAGFQGAVIGLAALTGLGVVVAAQAWPSDDPVEVEHTHHNLPSDHPHLQGGGHRHSHALIIDADHPRWARHF